MRASAGRWLRYGAGFADLAGLHFAAEEVRGHLPDLPVMVLREPAEQLERVRRRHPGFRVQDALGLLDHRPRLQGGVQVADHLAALPIQGRIAHGGTALGGEQQRDIVRRAGEGLPLMPVERDGAGRPAVGTQREHQATAEPRWPARCGDADPMIVAPPGRTYCAVLPPASRPGRETRSAKPAGELRAGLVRPTGTDPSGELPGSNLATTRPVSYGSPVSPTVENN